MYLAFAGNSIQIRPYFVPLQFLLRKINFSFFLLLFLLPSARASTRYASIKESKICVSFQFKKILILVNEVFDLVFDDKSVRGL